MSNAVEDIGAVRLLRAGEVARILSISRSLAYKLIQRNQIPAVKIGQCRRVRSTDLDEYYPPHLRGVGCLFRESEATEASLPMTKVYYGGNQS